MKLISALFLSFTMLFASIGKIINYDGDVTVLRGGKSIDGKIGLLLSQKDSVHTFKSSKVQIFFNDGTIVNMGQESQLNVSSYLYDKDKLNRSKTNFEFSKGAFRVVTGKIGKVVPKRFKLKTKNATIGIRGTIIVGDQRHIACTKGAIDVSARGKTVYVPAGMMTTTKPNSAPSKPVKYSVNDLEAIDVGVVYDVQDTQSMGSSSSNQQSAATHSSTNRSNIRNVIIESNVDGASNIARGSSNIAEQNIHSLNVQDGDVEYMYIKGKAEDIKNISEGIRNDSRQNIGSVNLQ